MKSFLIIGLGRFGRHMAAKLLEQGHSVLAVEKSEERADNAIHVVPDIQIGDSTNETFIESLGVSNFDICVVAVGDDFQTALITTALLKDHGAKYIVARAARDMYRRLLLRNGADHVVYAEREMAERLAMIYAANNVFDYIELTPDVGIYEIAPPQSWIGKSIVEKDVRGKYHVNILATKRGDEINPLPQPDYVFNHNENIMVLGTHKAIKLITDSKDKR